MGNLYKIQEVDKEFVHSLKTLMKLPERKFEQNWNLNKIEIWTKLKFEQNFGPNYVVSDRTFLLGNYKLNV